MKSFSSSSYLSQVRTLRALALVALKKYPLKVSALKFINHGENTTFCVTSVNGKKFLFRIHRNDYHSKAAILEEMQWLSHLAKKGLAVPHPLKSKIQCLVETVSHAGQTRNCSVFHWTDGTFLEKSLKPRHLFEIGKMLADFQNNIPKQKSKTRSYWTSTGLTGSHPTFGSIDNLNSVALKDQRTITAARKAVFKKLNAYQKRYPQRMGLIHADLHFGNILKTKKGLGAIDFDDCGHGFFAYDLIVPYLSMQNSLGKKKKRLFPEYKKALLDGYRTKRPWDRHDDEIFNHLVTARKLLMLGWLNSRSDNPRLKKYLKGAVKSALLHLKENK